MSEHLRQAIARLVDDKELDGETAAAAMRDIMGGAATPAQIGAFITALRIRGETPAVIAGCARAMRERFTPVPAPPGPLVDTCGTGGDRAGTFNISTAAAFVAAGAGVRVAKHGNRGVSSACGSADVLAALGVDLDAAAARAAECLERVGIAFLFAPALHPAMKHAIGPRREIGIRTVFNILGPLSNPAGARRGVLGVYAEALVPVMAEAALALGAEHLFVVHGSDGLDEITLTGPTRIAEAREGKVRVYDWAPEELGLDRCPAEALAGGDPDRNAALLRAVLEGEPGPRREAVLVNAAAAIVAGGGAPALREGYATAAASIDRGAARERLDALVAATRA